MNLEIKLHKKFGIVQNVYIDRLLCLIFLLCTTKEIWELKRIINV